MQELFSDPAHYYFPKITTALYSLALAFSLSSVIAFTYQYTFRGMRYSRNFFQAIVLSSMVAAIVMMAIGDSLARGLGILGALAIIRFRNRVRNPKNIIFIFSALSVGIACGVYGYTVAVAGTSIFCLIAVILYHSPYGRTETQEGNVTISLSNQGEEPIIRELLSNYCDELILVNLNATGKNELRAEYNVTLKSGVNREDLFNAVNNRDEVISFRISTREIIDRV